MKKANEGTKNRILSILLCLAMVAGLTVFASTESIAASWDIKFSRTSKPYTFSPYGYPGLQGLAFDTYTGKDGWCFATSKNEKKVALTHFTMNSKGKCKMVSTLVYPAVTIGHANDATLFVDGNGKKWLLVAVYGSVSDKYNVFASDGTKTGLAAISVDDFNNGETIVYNVDTADVMGDKLIRDKITGVTYIGNYESEEGGSVPEFVFMSGQRFVRAYLVQDGEGMRLVLNSIRARITKPKFSNGSAAAYHGVTYHSGYLYICAEGKSKKLATTMLITRIKLTGLFDGDDHDEKKLQVCQKKISKQGKTVLKKNGPEAVFFTNLNGKSNLYLSVNRLNKKEINSDEIIRSKATY